MDISAFATIAFGLLSAVSWGGGDFIGGYLTKRFRNLVVVFSVELFGFFLLLIIALVLREPIQGWRDFWIASAAGIIGMIGILSFYQGMARFGFGLVVPLTAVLTAIVPVVYGYFVDGLPGPLQVWGLGIAILSIWLISSDKNLFSDLARDDNKKLLNYVLVSGLSFGFFFLVIGQVSGGAVIWPVVYARATSLVLISGYFVFRKNELASIRAKLSGLTLFLLVLGGLLDTGGNVFFLLAAQAGRLDIASVLASLYPAITVFLAWALLKEKLTMRHFVGLGAAVISVSLISS
jgi:drug/metabolite transporter (DMT)-like permease